MLGDSVLDVWLSGTCHRQCREGPAQVVEIENHSVAPGAAANTAANLAALGVRVQFVTVIGNDDVGASLLHELRCRGVGTEHVVIWEGSSTLSKQRVLADDRLLLRVDRGAAHYGGPAAIAQVAVKLADALQTADALVISDYSHAMADSRVLAELHRQRSRLPLLVVDAHDLSRWRVLQPDLVTPSQSEAVALLAECGPPPPDKDRADYFIRHRRRLFEATGARTVAVTLDSDGVLVIDRDRPAYRTRTRPAHEENCAGAGDTFTAAMTFGLLRGLSLYEAADYGQSAANVVTQRPGTSVCPAEALEQRSDSTDHRPLTHDELALRVARDRAAGRRIVFTNGCFDILHRGHVAYLSEAKQAGDVLIVAINSDEGIRQLKGADRPINEVADRAAVVGALSCVDYVTVFDGETPVPLIERLRPDIYVKGGDYTPEMLTEAPVVRSYGGEVRILSYVAQHSTTETIQRIARGADVSSR